MNNETLNKIFLGLNDNWKKMLVGKHTEELTNILKYLNTCDIDRICPRIDLIFNFAKFCDTTEIKIVLLGQDPYIGEDEAMGLSFSCNKKIPPSLNNIYKNLLNKGLIKKLPMIGDLTSWARQGIILLNTSLTTMRGKSNAHKFLWEKYTDNLITQLSMCKESGIIFILLGNDAKNKREFITNPNCRIFTWCHPSPLNALNRNECPANFKYCDAFELANKVLIESNININWMPEKHVINSNITNNVIAASNTKEYILTTNLKLRPDEITVGKISEKLPCAPTDDIYIFTDGGCTGNGKSHAVASWSFYIVDKGAFYCACGIVPEIDLGGKYKTSNQRGELLAISKAMQFIDMVNTNSAECRLEASPVEDLDKKSIRHNYVINTPSGGISAIDFSKRDVHIYTDSKYSIGCYTIWAPSWIKTSAEKKNMDIIIPTYDIIEKIKTYTTINFNHIRSHVTSVPTDPVERFYYYGNDIADKLCSSMLKN